MILDKGRKHIQNYVGGNVNELATHMVVGIGDTAATLNQESLDLEIGKFPISLVASDPNSPNVVLKAVCPSEINGKFYELGLVYNSEEFSLVGETIVSFTEGIEKWSDAVWSTENSRVGKEALQISLEPGETKISSLTLPKADFSRYSENDNLVFAYQISLAEVTNVKLRLGRDYLNYFEYSFPVEIGYKIEKATKGSFVKVGQVYWDEISYVELSAVAPVLNLGTALVDFDLLKIEPLQNPNILVSRSVVITPFVKTKDKPLEIEYALEVN